MAAPVRTAHVEAELVSDRAVIEPGKPITVAVRLKMERGWHTYWQNPGESGLPTSVAWTLPPGLEAGPLAWPAPKTLKAGPLVNHGYDGEVLLLTDMRAAETMAPAPAATIAARVDWLVCKEVCIPEGADLSLALPVGSAAASTTTTPWSDAIARTRAALPQALQGWRVAAKGAGSKVELVLTPAGGSAADPGGLHFFAFEDGKVEASGAQTLQRKGESWTLTLPVASRRKGDFTRLAGVLVGDRALGAQGNAAVIDVPLKGSVVASAPGLEKAQAPVVAESGTAGLGVALAFAFLGGLLLNLMPCVFPVLSLKVLGFAAHGEGRSAMRLHGLAFAAGVFVSFWLLAGALLAFRATGAQLGWGFQLQSPIVVSALALLFFVLALNLSGVFEVRQLVPSALASWNARNAYINDGLSGVLAVVVASPCSAPFMGAALGFALTEPAASTLLIFTALAFGMAAPYMLLAVFPGWRSRLPRPGPWMLRLKQVLAFPLYATVIWLCWILGVQLDNDAVARLALILLLVAAALWSWQNMRAGGSRGWAYAAAVVFVVAGWVSWPIVSAPMRTDAAESAQARPSSDPASAWGDYAPDRLAQLTAEGRPVFVDFTAAWCVTCQVNKRLVLDTPAIDAAFTRAKVVLLRADWTRRDPGIARALAELGRNGVPVYVLYRPNHAPLVLPEVLQQRTILDALATLS